MSDGPLHAVFFGFVNHYGGSSISTVDLCRRLSRHIRVTIVDAYGSCAPFCEAVKEAGVEYRVLAPSDSGRIVGGSGIAQRAARLAASAPDLLRIRAALRRLLLELKPSLVWCNHFKSAAMIGFTPALRRLPLVLYLRGWYTPDMMPFYGRWLCRKATAVLALSHATRAALVCSGVDANRTVVVHNPLDVERFQQMAVRAPQQPLPQADRAVRLLLPADIIRSKGQHTGIEAMRPILAAGHDAVLWLAGEHAWPMGANKHYVAECRELARQLGVAERVEWLGRRTDMPQVMAASSIIVFPTHSEGQGRVLLEAMSLAKPVATCPAGGTLDMVCDNITGCLFDVDDAAGLSRCVLRFLQYPSFARKLGEQGREYIRLSFQPEQQTQQVLRLFQRVADGSWRAERVSR